jgi:hypothetical protein
VDDDDDDDDDLVLLLTAARSELAATSVDRFRSHLELGVVVDLEVLASSGLFAPLSTFAQAHKRVSLLLKAGAIAGVFAADVGGGSGASGDRRYCGRSGGAVGDESKGCRVPGDGGETSCSSATLFVVLSSDDINSIAHSINEAGSLPLSDVVSKIEGRIEQANSNDPEPSRIEIRR